MVNKSDTGNKSELDFKTLSVGKLADRLYKRLNCSRRGPDKIIQQRYDLMDRSLQPNQWIPESLGRSLATLAT